MGSPNRSRYFLIGLAVVLMAAVVAVVGQGLTAGRQPASVPPVAKPTPTLPYEAGIDARAARAADYAAMPREPNRKRTRAVYYARRAELGAAPVIPHAVDNGADSGGGCLACHASGGWVPRFAAYTPVTPHPELDSCRGCHEPAPPQGQATGAQTITPPALRGAAMPGAPPPIPHGLDMRERCQACHAGPGAVDEFRTSHPDRVGCRQCHALGGRQAEAFGRPLEGAAR
jgi:cytochrome c-type protein NapB